MRKCRQTVIIIEVVMMDMFLLVYRFTVGIYQSQVTALISNLSHWLCYANSAVNPLIYNFMSGKWHNNDIILWIMDNPLNQNYLFCCQLSARSSLTTKTIFILVFYKISPDFLFLFFLNAKQLTTDPLLYHNWTTNLLQ